jgi:hypothetical protein
MILDNWGVFQNVAYLLFHSNICFVVISTAIPNTGATAPFPTIDKILHLEEKIAMWGQKSCLPNLKKIALNYSCF